MSTFLPSNNLGQALSALATATTGKAPALASNAGTPITVQTVTASQLSFATQNQKATIPLSKPVPNVGAGKEYVARITSENQDTILQIAGRYLQKQVSLNAAQSQQVFASIAQSPGTISTDTVVKGKVTATQSGQIEVQIQGQRVSVPVNNSQNFTVGQQITLKLTGSQNQWQLSAQQGAIKSQQPVDNQTAANLLDRFSRAGSKVDITQTASGFKIAGAELKNLVPSGTEKVQITQSPQGKVSLQVQLSSEPIANIKIDAATAQKLLDHGVNQSKNFSLPMQPSPRAQDNIAIANPTTTKAVQQDEAATYQQLKPGKAPNAQFVDAVIQESKLSINLSANKVSSNDVASATKPQHQDTAKQPIANSPGQNNSDKPKVTSAPTDPQEPKTNPLQGAKTGNDRAINPELLLKKFNLNPNQESNQVVGKILTRVNELLLQQHAPPMSQQQVSNLVNELLVRVSPTSSPPPASTPPAAHLQLSQQLQQQITELADQVNTPELKQALQGVARQIPVEPAAMANVQVEQVKQLLQAPTIPNGREAIQAISSNSSNSFVAGLVSMLQLSLAARLGNQQPKLADQALQLFNTILSNTGNQAGKTNLNSKQMKDFGSLEQKKQLLKLAGEILNNHGQQKLANSERMIQGQESFHYILPFGSGAPNKPVELLIKREQDKEQLQEKQKPNQSIWSLTMKLSVGDVGDAITKARINGQKVDIDFFTSNHKLKDLIINFVPFLKKRLEQLGMNMQVGRCEQGEIPANLKARPYQILETRV